MRIRPREFLQLILSLEDVDSHGKQENVVDEDKHRHSWSHLADSNVSNRCSERSEECDADIVEVKTLSLQVIRREGRIQLRGKWQRALLQK